MWYGWSRARKLAFTGCGMESREKVAAIFGAGKRRGLKDKKTAAESCRGNYHWRDTKRRGIFQSSRCTDVHWTLGTYNRVHFLWGFYKLTFKPLHLFIKSKNRLNVMIKCIHFVGLLRKEEVSHVISQNIFFLQFFIFFFCIHLMGLDRLEKVLKYIF